MSFYGVLKLKLPEISKPLFTIATEEEFEAVKQKWENVPDVKFDIIHKLRSKKQVEDLLKHTLLKNGIISPPSKKPPKEPTTQKDEPSEDHSMLMQQGAAKPEGSSTIPEEDPSHEVPMTTQIATENLCSPSDKPDEDEIQIIAVIPPPKFISMPESGHFDETTATFPPTFPVVPEEMQIPLAYPEEGLMYPEDTMIDDTTDSLDPEIRKQRIAANWNLSTQIKPGTDYIFVPRSKVYVQNVDGSACWIDIVRLEDIPEEEAQQIRRMSIDSDYDSVNSSTEPKDALFPAEDQDENKNAPFASTIDIRQALEQSIRVNEKLIQAKKNRPKDLIRAFARNLSRYIFTEGEFRKNVSERPADRVQWLKKEVLSVFNIDASSKVGISLGDHVWQACVKELNHVATNSRNRKKCGNDAARQSEKGIEEKGVKRKKRRVVDEDEDESEDDEISD